eukprot:m.193011 g.193011  ORF g.193011 m.193011 type:complete len:406 (+) comp32489_c0_seq1:80-1297(+)
MTTTLHLNNTTPIMKILMFCAFVTFSAAESSCDSNNENCAEVQNGAMISFVGNWTSAKKSQMTILHQDPVTGVLQGYYKNLDASYPNCFNIPYVLTGFAYGPQITFDVLWQSQTESCNSTTSWTGNYDVTTGGLSTKWVLAREASNILGTDTFTKDRDGPEYNLFSEPTVNANVLGTWQSAYTSHFVVQSQSDSGLLSGYYINNDPKYPNCQGTPYSFTGWVLGDTIGFSVAWKNEVQDCGSTTAWAGYVQGAAMRTQWNMGLAVGSQRSILSGNDTFAKLNTPLVAAFNTVSVALGASIWKNELGSILQITNLQAGIISGVYINKAAGYACQNFPYPITGLFQPLSSVGGVISFSVAWQAPGAPSCGSVTGWAGQVSSTTMTTNWNLASASGIVQGTNNFARMS